MTKYFGYWKDYAEFARNWEQSKYEYNNETDNYRYVDRPPDGFPTDEEVVFATYGGDGYEGYAFVLFERNGVLYEVNDSHCSCNGLENWEPEVTTWDALRLRTLNDSSSPEAVEFFRLMVASK